MAGTPDTPSRAPATEAERRAAWIGEQTRADGPIHLADYDSAWPGLYEREAAHIRSLLGDRVRLLEHVGSTSIPGIAAKPIIDIDLAVPDSGDEPAYVPDLEADGYLLRGREPDWFEHRLLQRPDRSVNLHVFTAGSTEIDRMLAFRDRLRRNDDERRLYEATKRDLAARDWVYVQDYADAKSEIVAVILARATAEG
jgi:GrpB-like predicted nucleotidyltransferase (UPF0157 family)